MLDTVALNFELPLAWTPNFMPQEDKTPSVEELANSFGEETVIFRVGQKMIYVTMGEDWQRSDLFIMTIQNVYVKDLEKRHGYQYPASFEMNEKGGHLEVSREDEKALVDFIANQNIQGIEWRKQHGEKAMTYRVVGSHFSAENGAVYENPASPDSPPTPRKDHRLEH